MTQIDQHAEAIHFVNDFLTEGGQAMVRGGIGRGVGPLGIRHVRQGHVPRPKLVHLPQDGQGVVDLVATFDTDQAGDLAGFVDAPYIGS
jgi:hypothetical protein